MESIYKKYLDLSYKYFLVNGILERAKKLNDETYLKYHQTIKFEKLKLKLKLVPLNNQLYDSESEFRTKLNKTIRYIYDNKLQSKTNRSCILIDDHLKTLLKPLPMEGDKFYTYYNLHKYLIR